MLSLTVQQIQQIVNEEETNARGEFIAERSQGAGGLQGQGLMEVDGMDDDYDYYESQPKRYDRMKSRVKPASEQDLDDNVVTPDNVDVYDKKKIAIYSVDGYTTAIGFGHPQYQYKRNWKKQYYSDVNDLERAALAAKLKQQGIKGGPYMKWLSITIPHKIREIKLHDFRAFSANTKKIIDQNGCANLPMATKQQILASIWNSVFITPALDILETLDGKIEIYNRNNKAHVKFGDYEYYLISKRVYKKEQPIVIAQLYIENQVGNKIAQALAQAIQYYRDSLAQRQQQINCSNLAKYNCVQNNH
ncbi:MAG: hypothetical protein EZS28_013262 [Streblomastix strix]|uniref:Uncharacterized protein n=1 Tax=Streblomastix strix TaxID=222440 RepID=A0A5J4W8M1_9EUKA|nr:MAG: hypothetical protein EZS28_013262 [Streblomastix strix]